MSEELKPGRKGESLASELRWLAKHPHYIEYDLALLEDAAAMLCSPPETRPDAGGDVVERITAEMVVDALTIAVIGTGDRSHRYGNLMPVEPFSRTDQDYVVALVNWHRAALAATERGEREERA